MIFLVVQQGDIAWFTGVITLAVATLIAMFIFGYVTTKKGTCPSPYTGMPLRKGSDLSWGVMETVLKFLFDRKERENPMFDLHNASWCRQTGRIFPDSVSLLNTIHVDWKFLEKRYPGRWRSWGSLTERERFLIESRHGSLEHFQTSFSSKEKEPANIEEEFALKKPGPLYVDLASGNLLGWQEVPNTGLEVLIVQKPIK